MSRIVVDDRFCKGCGLCVDACSQGILALDLQRINEKGYHPAMLTDPSKCTACTFCALMCPDCAITVYKEVG